MHIHDEDCDVEPLELDDFVNTEAQSKNSDASSLASVGHSIHMARLATIRESRRLNCVQLVTNGCSGTDREDSIATDPRQFFRSSDRREALSVGGITSRESQVS